jgi:predicted TIM-barrel fold metal-dependent hydrolase
VFARHPALKLSLSEGGIGWIPYVLERCDYVAARQRYWATGTSFTGDLGSATVAIAAEGGGLDLTVPPSQVFRQHVYGCFIDDIHGAANARLIGIDNIMIETDYPHTDSTWPNSLELAYKRLAHLDDESRDKILRGNAQRVFNFTPAVPSS